MLRLDSYQVAARIVFLVTLAGVLLLAFLPVQLSPDIGWAVHQDKLNHAAAFAVLAALGSLGWPERKVRLIVLLAFTGAAIEVLQGAQLIGRDMDAFDLVADCAGMAFGLTIASWTKRRRVGGLP
ncbi:hypothetical protein GCM10010869_49840 [Mesorhizobium tianshanense]|uniref:VanZ like protein n=1 Tax=Mesorhizobium tianshanense TaxID=39844 RepID=A0A562MD49_9HYPH|nr:hypothetical protein [Mesorhizobium tianshanense]TWI17810.1 hypothetical protein IQ26_07447 [Mesorhizobium tianshanense]GLS39387.1 hypothetical protein GCM10010869_49840 [Mesorhizobium tianshanense]